MWDLIVSVPDHCLSFYFLCLSPRTDHISIFIINIGHELNSRLTTHSSRAVVNYQLLLLKHLAIQA